MSTPPNWAIVSNNCWGAGLYQERRLRYNTPFVGLFLYPDDYVMLLQNFRALMSQQVSFREGSRLGPRSYPVGVLGGEVEIQFMHYQGQDEALRKWSARAARLPVDDDALYFKACDREGFAPAHLAAFGALPFRNKVAFVKKGRFDVADCPWAVEVPTTSGAVPDGDKLWAATRSGAMFNAYDWVGRTPQGG